MIDPRQPDYNNSPASSLRSDYGYVLANHEAPVVSIITPFYNTGQIFHETAKSIFRQSLQAWQWLIVNDGSTSAESLDVLDQYRRIDPRVRVIDLETNCGLSAARNVGIREAQTDFCLLLDSDDMLEPTAAEIWYWHLLSHPEYSFVSSDTVCFGALNYLWHGGIRDKEQNLERNRISCIGIVRRSIHQKLGGFDETMRGGLEDWDFWLRCAANGLWGNSICEYLGWIRTRQQHSDRWSSLTEEKIVEYRDNFRARHPQLWENGFPDVAPVIDLEVSKVDQTIPGNNLLRKSKPRLLVIAPWLVVGGAEAFNLDLINQLIKHGWEITVVTTAEAEHVWRHLFTALTPDVFTVDTFLDYPDIPRFLVYLAKSRQIDIIMIASSLEAYRLLPYLREQLPAVPVFDYLHMVSPDWLDGGVPRFSLLYDNFIDLTIVSSSFVKQWLIDHGTADNKIAVVTINVNPEYWQPDEEIRSKKRQELQIDPETLVILFVARLEAQKQPLLACEAFRLLHKQDEQFRAFIIGDGSLRNDVDRVIQTYELQDKVKLLGNLSGENVRVMMQMADVVFLPSLSEGIAKAFYEGMACGLVPVGTAVGGQSELVDQACGILLEEFSSPDVAQSFADILAELAHNPQRRAEMAQASRKRILEHFHLEQMGLSIDKLLKNQKYKALYWECINPDHMVEVLTRQTVEYLRAINEIRKIETRHANLSKEMSQLVTAYNDLHHQYAQIVEHPPIPNLPVSSYFYLTLRSLLLPVYNVLLNRFGNIVNPIKRRLKSSLFRRND